MKREHPFPRKSSWVTLCVAALVRPQSYSKRLALTLGLLLSCIGLTAFKQEAKANEQDTSSISIGVSLGGFVSGSTETESLEISGVGPTIILDYPLWLGEKSTTFQWVLDANAMAIYGTDSKNARFSLGPQFGFDVDMGKIFGWELRQGLSAVGHLGDDNHLAMTLSTRAAFVVRVFENDRKRFKIQLIGQFSPFPSEGNESRRYPDSAGAVGVAYEAPF